MHNSPSPNSSNSNHLPPWIWWLLMAILVAVGSPVATYIASPQFILHHPLEAGGIALLSAIVVLIIGFFARFLNQLQNDWANASAEWFKRLLEDLLFSYHYQEHYYKWLRNGELKFLDERGLSTLGAQSMVLEQIFVELAVDYTFPHKPDNFLEEPQQELPERLREGPHSVWEYLSIQKKRQKMEIKPRLVILGPPGSGKTTLLQHITLVLANRKNRKNYQQKYGFQFKLPFLLSLRKYSELTKSSSSFSLVEAVQTELILAENSASKRWVERQLREGHCIILLDGLDEIGNLGSRRKMVNWVQDQIKQFGNNCFVITSRRFGYLDNPLIGVTVLGIQNFTISQLKDFIYKWYAAQNNKNQTQRGYEVAIGRADPEDLLQRLRKNLELFKLAGNPLMLDMIARIHFYRKKLPDSRVELYKEIFEVFLGKRRIAIEVEQELTPEQMQRVLQHLAYSMMVNKELEIQEVEAEDVIKRPLADESELLTPKAYLKKVYEISQILLKVEEGPDRYTFVHRTFQEYLAAKYIQKHSLERVLEDQLESDWWHETILLYCAMADATPIILACLNKALSKEILELALRLREEPIYAKPDVIAQLDGVISKGAEDTDPKMWHMIAEAGLKHRTEHMLPQKNIYIDRSFITSVEYQLFLDQPNNHGLQPDHWQNDRFSKGQGLYPVLGVRPLDVVAFCKWLTTWEASEWEYRLPTRKELVDITVTQPDIGYWFNDSNNYEVNWIRGGPTASSILNQDQLKLYLEQDNPQFNPLVLGTLPETDDYRNLVAHIPLANRLAYDASKLYKDLMSHLRSIREYITIQERKLENIYKDASKVRINLENKIFELRSKKDKNEEIINKIVTLNDQIGKSREIQVNLQSQLDRLQARFDVLDKEKSKLNENLLKPNKTLLKIEREKNKLLRSQLASRDDSQQRNQSSYQFAKNSNIQLPNQSQHQFIVNKVVEQQKQLQEQINFLEEKKKNLMEEQRIIQEEKSELDKQQSEESSREAELRKLLSTIGGNNKKTELTQELRDIEIQLEKLSQQKLVAIEKEEKEKQEYDTFSLHASEFYKICDDFSLFTPSTLADNTSNGNAQPFYQLLSEAVKRNKWLNLDHILVSTNSGNFDVYSYISTFIRELTKRLAVYHDKVNININNYNIKSEIGKALDNSRQLASILSIENVQKLGDLLRSCLRKLTTDRSLIREQLTRFYIRYFAKMLTKHLSDWLPSKGFREMSGVDVDRYQNLVGKYSDLYVAFVLLEERINGELLANEGILIVKERRSKTK